VPGVCDQDRVDRTIFDREIRDCGLMHGQCRVALANKAQHPAINLGDSQRDVFVLDESISELPCACADLDYLARVTEKPIDGAVRIRRTAILVLVRPSAE
jgi:hypothetical protein